jgi:hypothetical protein
MREMTDAETAAHLREYVNDHHDTFSWPTDACGYNQHIKFVGHRNTSWQGGTMDEFRKFILAYADTLDGGVIMPDPSNPVWDDPPTISTPSLHPRATLECVLCVEGDIKRIGTLEPCAGCGQEARRPADEPVPLPLAEARRLLMRRRAAHALDGRSLAVAHIDECISNLDAHMARAAGDLTEDQRDGAIARRRLKEMEDDPSKMVSGPELEARLAELDPPGDLTIEESKSLPETGGVMEPAPAPTTPNGGNLRFVPGDNPAGAVIFCLADGTEFVIVEATGDCWVKGQLVTSDPLLWAGLRFMLARVWPKGDGAVVCLPGKAAEGGVDGRLEFVFPSKMMVAWLPDGTAQWEGGRPDGKADKLARPEQVITGLREWCRQGIAHTNRMSGGRLVWLAGRDEKTTGGR